MWHSKVLGKTLEGFGRCLVPTWHGRNLANPCPRGLALQSSEGRGGHTLVRAGSCPGGGSGRAGSAGKSGLCSGDPQRGAGAAVRPVAPPTAFVFCYVLWVAGRISALLRRGDLGPEWRGQLSGVTQLRGSSHNCEVAKRTLTAAFGTTTTWRGPWAGGVGGGRSPTANGGSHRLEMDREWSLLFQKVSPACERLRPRVRLLLGPTCGAGCGCPHGFCLLPGLHLPQTALPRARCPGRPGRLEKSRAGCRAECSTVRPERELRGAPSRSPLRPHTPLRPTSPLHRPHLYPASPRARNPASSPGCALHHPRKLGVARQNGQRSDRC